MPGKSQTRACHRRAAGSQPVQRVDLAVDPVALLHREHDMILHQLALIEAMIDQKTMRCRRLTATSRSTLLELLKFFVHRVGVHFKREAIVIAALGKSSDRKRHAPNQFQSLLDEHRMLKADALAIRKLLGTQGTVRVGGPLSVTKPKAEGRSLAAELAAFVRRYRSHLSCEERIVFVLANMRLTSEQKRRIGDRMLQI